MRVFSNIHLYKIPYYYIDSIDKLRNMKDGWVAIDELWSILRARCSTSKRNQVVGDILLRSRKLNLTYCFTTQLLSLIDKNVRSITDFTAYPLLNPDETICKLVIFKGGSSTSGQYLKTIYYRTDIPMSCYNTNEIVDMKDESDKPLEIRFQENFNPEHGNFCSCEECKGQVFKTWEDAEKVANEYWLSLHKKGVI